MSTSVASIVGCREPSSSNNSKFTGGIMRIARLIAACGIAVAAACGDSEDPLQPPAGPPVATAGVTVQDNSFGPATVLLSAGGDVTWTWAGNNAHNISFTSGTNRPAGTPGAMTTGTYQA